LAVAPEVLTAAFKRRYPQSPAPAVYRAPGRVNLIGEHTDYTEGFVLPIALDLACYVAVAPAEGDRLTVYSVDMNESFSVRPEDLASARPEGNWRDYIVGVARELIAAGHSVPPFILAIHSTVPIGAGLSSSASLEVATALALLNGRPIDQRELARLARRAENNFVGVPCGVMDQMISVFGEPGSALLIDCRDLSLMPVPLPQGGLFLAVNSMVKHELGASAYRERVAECQAAVEAVRRAHPEVRSLRDVKSEHLTLIEGTPRRRAAHVVSENQRVQDFVASARAGDLAAMGRRMVGSHVSLQRDYEVSCAELDFLVSSAISVQGVLGSRMTGGGFGGCTVNLMMQEAEGAFRERITQAYRTEYGIDPEFYPCIPSPGAGQVPVLRHDS
jgi:galactokinase